MNGNDLERLAELIRVKNEADAAIAELIRAAVRARQHR